MTVLQTKWKNDLNKDDLHEIMQKWPLIEMKNVLCLIFNFTRINPRTIW